MKILKFILVPSLLLSFAANSFAARVPACWLKSSACSNETLQSNVTQELDESTDKIFEMKSNFVEKIGEKFDKKKKYFLASLKTEIGVAAEGEIGIMESGGEAALEMVWVRNLPKKRDKTNEKKFQNEFFGNDTSLDLTYADDLSSVKQTVSNLAHNLYQQGKIKDQDLFTNTAISEIKKIMGLKNLINQDPSRPWWPYKLQLELFFQAEGGLSQGPIVGSGFKLKLVWNRMMRKDKLVEKSMLTKIDKSNTEVLAAMAEEFEEAYARYQQISANDKTHYDFNNVKIGVGVGFEGNIYVAKSKGEAVASLFYKRDPQNNDNKSFKPQASKTNLTRIPFMEQQNSLMVKNLNFNSILREKLGSGLKRFMTVAHYFSKKAQAREEQLLQNGKTPAFSLDFMEIELEIFLSGDVGITSLTGISVMEIFLSKRI